MALIVLTRPLSFKPANQKWTTNTKTIYCASLFARYGTTQVSCDIKDAFCTLIAVLAKRDTCDFLFPLLEAALLHKERIYSQMEPFLFTEWDKSFEIGQK